MSQRPPQKSLKSKGPVVIGWLMAGQSTPGFVSSITRTVAVVPQMGVDLIGSIPQTSGPRIAAARNNMATHFLATPAEWLFMVDDDMTFDADALPRLLEAADRKERPIVGGLAYAAGRDGYFSTIWTVNPEHGVPERIDNVPPNKLLQVVGTGAACLLVHRSVFEKMFEKYGDTPWPFFQEAALAGEPVGEDVTFCFRAGELGFPIFVDTGVEFGHEKTVNIDRAFVDMWRAAHRVVISGTGRCGTGYMAMVLTAAAIPATHEGVWSGAGYKGWDWQRVESSWLAAPHLKDFDGQVIHLVRDPLKVVASMQVLGLFLDEPPAIGASYAGVVRQQIPDLFDDPNVLNRIIRYVVEWNELVAESANYRIRIEDVDEQSFQQIAEMVGSRHSAIDFDGPMAKVPTNYNHKAEVEALGWDDLPDGEWKDRLREQAKEYGYEGK